MPSGSIVGHTWPKHARILRRPDFVRVQQDGRRLSTRDLVVRYIPASGAGPRFGLTVSRKVGNAVVRNQVKRWLRESLRQRRGAVSSVDMVLIARGSAANAGFSRLDSQVGEIFRRLQDKH